jgi:hypothetical protein
VRIIEEIFPGNSGSDKSIHRPEIALGERWIKTLSRIRHSVTNSNGFWIG